MSLTFGAETENRISCGSEAGIDDTIQTVLLWVRVTTLTGGRCFISKRRAASADGWRFSLLGTAGDISYFHETSLTNAEYNSNNTPVAVNVWTFVAVTITRATFVADIYTGTLSAPATEVTYGTATAGTGTNTSDASRSLFIGNMDDATPAQAMPGQIACAAVYSSILTLAEIVDWQFNPRAGANCLGFWCLGFDGAGTQADWSASGNNGTVTGATFSTQSPFGTFRKVQQVRPVMFGMLR